MPWPSHPELELGRRRVTAPRTHCDGCNRQSPKEPTTDPFTMICGWCGHHATRRTPTARAAGLWLELSQPSGDR